MIFSEQSDVLPFLNTVDVDIEDPKLFEVLGEALLGEPVELLKVKHTLLGDRARVVKVKCSDGSKKRIYIKKVSKKVTI